MDIQDAVAPLPSENTPSPVRHKYVVGSVIALLICGAIGGAYYYYAHSSYGALYGIRYLAGPYESRTLQELGLRGPHGVSLDGSGKVIDQVRSGDRVIDIRESSNGTQDVYLSEGMVALTQDGKTKAGLTLSPDASLLAFAVRESMVPATSTPDFYAIDAWRIKLHTLKDSHTEDLGVGFAPQLFSRNGISYVGYLSSSSVRIVNLDTRSTQDMPFNFGTQHSYVTMSISPDGSFALLPDIATNYRLYELTESDGFFRLTPGMALPEGTQSAVFKGGNIISVSGTATDTYIRSSTIAAPGVIMYARSIPKTFIFKVIP